LILISLLEDGGMISFPYRLLARPSWKKYQLGAFQQYPAQPSSCIPLPPRVQAPNEKLRICLVTPSYQQGEYLERTIQSVLNQKYSALSYGVQDGGSNDGSEEILARYQDRLDFAASAPDQGQTDAIIQGFAKLKPGPMDLMAWLNSDDLLLPGALDYVNGVFLKNPEMDVLYGHRILIDSSEQEIGRWYLPPFHREILQRVDFIPQETLFFRASAYFKVGGLDPSFQFAMDWDLLLRFQEAGCKFQRSPHFWACFRIHEKQKTACQIHEQGEKEIHQLRLRSLNGSYSRAEIDHLYWREVLKSRLASLFYRPTS
jgi:glycosyltransferase involved in cell wall biosynthesis